ncbi:MAG: HIT family protein [Bacteroidota bacterium]
MPECLFCDIVSGRNEAAVVFEDEASLAFLDRSPLFHGHCLLIPREHYATLMDLPQPLIGPLFSNAQLLARAVETALGAQGIFVGINNRVSQSVHHMHIHIVPRVKGDGLKGFFWPRHKYPDDAAMDAVAGRIRAAIGQIKVAE